MDVGQPASGAVVVEGEPLVVEAEEVENGRVEVMDVDDVLDGTTDWPAVMEALAAVGYDGYLTFEYFHPFPHYPEALIYQTSDALDRMLGRKS